MKYALLILMFLSTLHSFGLDKNPNNDQSNNSSLVLTKDKRSFAIKPGKKILIRVGDIRYKGKLNILNDSMISIDKNTFLLSEIDMIAKSKAGKTIGLSLAGGLLGTMGFAIMEIVDGDYTWMAGGIGVLLTVEATIMECIRGKRFRAYEHSKMNQVKKVRKWAYSIQTNN